jgi:hypothetical protein
MGIKMCPVVGEHSSFDGRFIQFSLYKSKQGTLTKRERFSTVDLLVKVACLTRKKIIFVVSKEADLN